MACGVAPRGGLRELRMREERMLEKQEARKQAAAAEQQSLTASAQQKK